ncbi:MAG: type II toxin-antitoxin system Phd/YefM family antitoxin [Deltaproteobacteria bacterium]|nr:type II toxin-antitoxin system Phd/YefM family antitoxin [Deltaproteobacteria bacterium]
MKNVTFTEFRKQASSLFNDVEKGEIIHVIRHGKPIAEISPISKNNSDTPSWKRPALNLVTKGAGLSKAILEERNFT